MYSGAGTPAPHGASSPKSAEQSLKDKFADPPANPLSATSGVLLSSTAIFPNSHLLSFVPDGVWRVPYLLASHSVRISVSRRLRDVSSRDRSRGRFHRAGVSRVGSWALAPLRLPRLSKRAGTKLDDSRVLQQGPFGTLDRTRSVLAQGLGRRPKV